MVGRQDLRLRSNRKLGSMLHLPLSLQIFDPSKTVTLSKRTPMKKNKTGIFLTGRDDQESWLLLSEFAMGTEHSRRGISRKFLILALALQISTAHIKSPLTRK